LESDVWSDIRGVVNYISIYGFSATLILVLVFLKRYGRNQVSTDKVGEVFQEV
jgi:hypothetical protein